ncbi:unnamed protein product [Schistosoma mattheei]|uniref:Uncharacterized protein n=1 Tax=Schistosoma mattheei TaxID=31246 RepID=A0A183P2C5_9TREM|nr:unnamed protein product [Schistosoma mattheei]
MAESGGGEKRGVVEEFVYLGSYISAGGGVSDDINARILKAKAAYANLDHLWRLRDVSLAVEDRIYNASWQHHVSNAEVRHRVFGHIDDNSIGVTILKHRLRWLGHVLRMSSQRIPRRALFADSGTGWGERRGGHCMT